MYFDWNDEKNKFIKKQREICFEDFVQAFNDNKVLDIIEHHDKINIQIKDYL